MKHFKILQKVFFVLFSLCFYVNLHPQDIFINPGVKFSLDFDTKESIFGVELSIVRSTDALKYGVGSSINVDYYSVQKKYKLFLGCQANYHVLGISIGPTIVFDNKNKFGFSAIPYVGAMLIPYFNYTFLINSPDLKETGMFVKLPILVSGFTSWYPIRITH